MAENVENQLKTISDAVKDDDESNNAAIFGLGYIDALRENGLIDEKRYAECETEFTKNLIESDKNNDAEE